MTLLGRSVLVLGLLFGLLFAVSAAALAYFQMPLVWGAAAAAALILLQYAIAPYIIQWIYRIRWVDPGELAPAVREYLDYVCQKTGIPVPRLGIIEDGNPNAFTFGHYPRDARLVLTRGLVDLLDEEEQKAVVGHEVGHIVHWDFVVMTVAAMVPLLLYMVYRVATGENRRSSRDRGGYAAIVGIIAYVAYLVSQYIVLFLSRVREYYADEFSGYSTRNPAAMARALVKVGYGLARAPKEEPAKRTTGLVQAGKAFGIFDPKVAGNLALAAAGSSAAQGVTADAMVGAMKWDLWNPWATWYELNSTHPLPARRIRMLEKLSRRVGQPPAFDFPESAPESYWDEFAADLATHLLPVIGALIGLGVGLAMAAGSHRLTMVAGPVLLGLGVGSLAKLVRSHPQGRFEPRTVESLVGEVKVSGVRPVPCVVEGKIIGRGVPGLYWSEDLVLQDDTGFIVLDYRQPLRLLEVLFGAFRAERLIGQEARAIGWYRRAPRPYVELLRVELQRAPAQRCWVYAAELVLAGLAMLAGLTLVVFFGIGAGL